MRIVYINTRYQKYARRKTCSDSQTIEINLRKAVESRYAHSIRNASEERMSKKWWDKTKQPILEKKFFKKDIQKDRAREAKKANIRPLLWGKLPSEGRIIEFHYKETSPGMGNIKPGKGRHITTACNLLQQPSCNRNECDYPSAWHRWSEGHQ